MTVRELIQELLDHDLDAQVYVQSKLEGGPAQDFELVWHGTALMLNRTRDAVAPVRVQSEFKVAMAALDELQATKPVDWVEHDDSCLAFATHSNLGCTCGRTKGCYRGQIWP